MKEFYDAVYQDAVDLINEDGIVASLVTYTKTGPSYDPTLVPVETDIQVVRSSWTYKDKQALTIEQGDIKLLMLAEDGKFPAMGNKVRVPKTGGDVYSIVDVIHKAPGPKVIYHILQGRR